MINNSMSRCVPQRTGSQTLADTRAPICIAVLSTTTEGRSSSMSISIGTDTQDVGGGAHTRVCMRTHAIEYICLYVLRYLYTHTKEYYSTL